jgi:hypothetical protein
MFADGWHIISISAQLKVTMADGSVQVLPPLIDSKYPRPYNYRIVQSLLNNSTSSEAPFFDYMLQDTREKYPQCTKIESACVAEQVNEEKIATLQFGARVTSECYNEVRVNEVLWSK